MKRGMDWYQRDPVDFLGGVQGLPAREIAVYAVTLDLIYQHGGEINNDPGWIAGWISDMGAAAVRNALAGLVEKGKLQIEENGNIGQKRAKNEAKTRRKQSETNAENGKKGGISSGKSRAVSSKNNGLYEANASSENEAEKRREENIGGGDAREADPPHTLHESDADTLTHREQLLEAMGADPVSGLIGPNGRLAGSPGEMIHVQRWSEDLGLTLEDQLLVIRDVMSRKANDPPTTLRYFTKAMERFAGEKAMAPLTPQSTRQLRAINGGRHEASTFDAKHAEFTRRVASGEIDLGPDPSDPFSGE